MSALRFFAAVAAEFDSRPGPVRDRIAEIMKEWLSALRNAIVEAQDAGHLNKEIDAVIADPQMETRLVELGGTPVAMSPAKFRAFVADETVKWEKVVKFSGAKTQ